MFSILWHRQARWFRYNPESRFVKIRIPSTIPRQHDGSPLPTGSVLESDRWLHLGKYFKTGPEFTFSIYDPMERQVRWLKRIRPDYLLTYPGVFEELGLACAGASPAESLKSLLGIGSCAPPTLRARIEDIYHVPFHQNYGLNEVGIVAIRCLAGRYHVNTEHCVVEIVDDQGRPCPPGESGHLLVTALHNVAMPLIRYDTDDIAVVSEGACPCGRTLPSFGEIIGRYRRYVGLPPNTRKRVRVLGDALSTMPVELTENLRRYQIYQDRNNHFEVRLRTVGPMPAEFAARLQECWQEVAGDPPDPLTIIENAKIVDSPGGKILDFDSEFYLAEDRSALTQIQGHAAPSAENSSPTS
jgi:phenylacetate-CoA ligase